MKDILPKFKFKTNGVVIGAPAPIAEEFRKLGFKTEWPNAGFTTNTLVFINDLKELNAFLGKQFKKVEPDSVLWLAYPKRTSKVKSDINRDSIRETTEGYGIATVTAISIDDTWSGLRFRPIEKVGK